ncbi:MAG: hypothetical protein EBR82_31975 [Caulobacteraceae bacterium]|nr:hypothetical protein [Caulobacteraceae bacterium]
MKFSEELITPEIAKQLLEGNEGNRVLRCATVEFLRLAILRGEWKLSHQGIAIANDGRLIDGQHRLTAIVEANVAVLMMVARDVPPETFQVVDRGVRRTLADVAREDRILIEIASLIAQLHNNRTPRGMTDGNVLAALEAFRPEITSVRLAVPRASKRASAPIRVAASFRICLGTPADYVLSLLDQFVGLKEAMPPVAMALLRQIDKGSVSARNDKWDLLARALIMFDPKKRSITKMQVNDVTTVLEVAADLVKARLTAAKVLS